MHFLVFIPDCKPADLEQAAKTAGLTPILGGHDVIPRQEGPIDGGGLFVGHLGPGGVLEYQPAKQTWVPSIAKDDNEKPRYYVGFWNDKPPIENELRRPYTQDGNLVKLGSMKWKLPTPDTVDSRAVYTDDGSMRWEVIRQFSWVCDEAKILRDQYLEEFGVREIVFRVDPSQQVGWLLKLLQINYRILPEVAQYLDMWVGKDHIIDTVLNTLGLHRKASEA